MIRIIIYGVSGKMGKTVYSIASAPKGVEVVCGVDKIPSEELNCPVFNSLAEFGGQADAIIDFSSPSSLNDICAFAEMRRCAVVFATTGYAKDQVEKITALSKKVPVSLMPSAAPAMNALYGFLPDICRALDNFDVSIIETHRVGKKDKPSGTALKLKSIIDCSRAGSEGAEIHSVRGGDVPGTHEITFFGKSETLSVRHVVYSREVFAEGAVNECMRLCASDDIK